MYTKYIFFKKYPDVQTPEHKRKNRYCDHKLRICSQNLVIPGHVLFIWSIVLVQGHIVFISSLILVKL